jgi:uncharacterized membrane protein YhaH (DUF805 family)
MRNILFKLTQGSYWLALGTWFGAIVMLIIAAAITFKTTREYQVTIGKAPLSAPAIAAKAPDIMAGAIVGRIIRVLAAVQALCAVTALAAAAAQCTIFRRQIWRQPVKCCGIIGGTSNVIRLLLLLAAVACFTIDVAVIAPRLQDTRPRLHDPSLPVDQREEARKEFDADHKRSEWLAGSTALLLLGTIMVSACALHRGDMQSSLAE